MPGISVAPAPSITVHTAEAIERRTAGNAVDTITLHQHFTAVRHLAAAVENADVGKKHVGHDYLLHAAYEWRLWSTRWVAAFAGVAIAEGYGMPRQPRGYRLNRAAVQSLLALSCG